MYFVAALGASSVSVHSSPFVDSFVRIRKSLPVSTISSVRTASAERYVASDNVRRLYQRFAKSRTSFSDVLAGEYSKMTVELGFDIKVGHGITPLAGTSRSP
jgi:hypothetical protein